MIGEFVLGIMGNAVFNWELLMIGLCLKACMLLLKLISSM